MSLSPDQIERLARLARIALGAEEGEQLRAQLNRLLVLIDQMQAVDTRGIEPMSHALEVVQRLRPDEVTESDRRAEFQQSAPAIEAGLYVVPRVIE